MDINDIVAMIAVFAICIPALVFLVIFVVNYQKARGDFIKSLTIDERALIARYDAVSFLDAFKKKKDDK